MQKVILVVFQHFFDALSVKQIENQVSFVNLNTKIVTL